MKTASISQIKKDLRHYSEEELNEICLKLAKYKKENKEYLTYLLYDSSNEIEYINSVKESIVLLFQEMNLDSYFYMKKTIRKAQRLIKKYIKFSKQKETEVELLLFFCNQLAETKPSIKHSVMLTNLFYRQLEQVEKKISLLHEDLQFDFRGELDVLSGFNR